MKRDIREKERRSEKMYQGVERRKNITVPRYEIGLLSENLKIKTRPEEQPIDTAVPDIAKYDGG
jgi:hypothetical protein